MALNNALPGIIYAYRRPVGFQTAKEVRQLFTTLVLQGAPATALWEIFQDDFAADFTSNVTQP